MESECPNATDQGAELPVAVDCRLVALLHRAIPIRIGGDCLCGKVDMLVAHGDIVGAQAASKSAKTWVGVSVGCSLLLFIAWFLLVVVFGTLASEL